MGAVEKIREEYPRWGKDKSVILLGGDGFICSASTVGRIIHRLKQKGVLKEPIRNHVSAHRRGLKRPYAIRRPKDHEVKEPGDLVLKDEEFPLKSYGIHGKVIYTPGHSSGSMSLVLDTGDAFVGLLLLELFN